MTQRYSTGASYFDILVQDGRLEFEDVIANATDRCQKLWIRPSMSQINLVETDSNVVLRQLRVIELLRIPKQGLDTFIADFGRDSLDNLLRREWFTEDRNRPLTASFANDVTARTELLAHGSERNVNIVTTRVDSLDL